MFALFLVLVQFLQAALGYSALRAATGLLPMAVVMMPLAAVSPTIADRWGYRRTVTTGMVLTGLSLGLMALLADEKRGYLSILIPLLLQGAGVGLSMSPSTTAITASLPEEKQGVASALNDTVREMGGAIGIALLGSVLNASYRSNVSATAERLPPDLAEPVKEGIGGAIAVASQMGAEGAGVMQAARAAFTDGMRPALMIGMAVSLATAAYTTLSGRRVASQPSEPAVDAVDAVDTKLLGG